MANADEEIWEPVEHIDDLHDGDELRQEWTYGASGPVRLYRRRKPAPHFQPGDVVVLPDKRVMRLGVSPLGRRTWCKPDDEGDFDFVATDADLALLSQAVLLVRDGRYVGPAVES